MWSLGAGLRCAVEPLSACVVWQQVRAHGDQLQPYEATMRAAQLQPTQRVPLGLQRDQCRIPRPVNRVRLFLSKMACIASKTWIRDVF